jgi:hypothetical protein
MKTMPMTAAAFGGLALGATSPAGAVIQTFATITATTADNVYFKNAATNNRSVDAAFYTIANPSSKFPGAVGVKISFIDEGAALDSAVHDVNAMFTLDASTSTAAQKVMGDLVQPGVSGDFTIRGISPIMVGDVAYPAGSNLLIGAFSDAVISGLKGSTMDSMGAGNEGGPSTVSFSSDFVSFQRGAIEEAAFDLTSITAALGDAGQGTYSLKAFKPDTCAEFASDPAPSALGAPEPATWAMMLVGVGGDGALARRRKAAVAA